MDNAVHSSQMWSIPPIKSAPGEVVGTILNVSNLGFCLPSKYNQLSLCNELDFASVVELRNARWTISRVIHRGLSGNRRRLARSRPGTIHPRSCRSETDWLVHNMLIGKVNSFNKEQNCTRY